MTRLEEKLYLQTVYDAIDQVYKLKKSQPMSSYEERLRASVSKLIIPDWYNPDYTATNSLRKTKSHGHVPRSKRINASAGSPDISTSSANGNQRSSCRHRSPSRSWSERPPLRHDSTSSSYDTNGSVVNGRRSTTSNGSSYAPGVQRVAQSSTWYKPKIFTLKGTSAPPKPPPRYSKIDQERIHSSDSSAPPPPPASLPTKSANARFPIKPRTMAQAQVPREEPSTDISADADMTLVQKPAEEEISRTSSMRSLSSEAESYRSAVLPPGERNLASTDSSSYASVNDRCVSPSTASYHTAVADDTSSSLSGYETPTPRLDRDNDDDETLSSRSSLSDLTHTETNDFNLPDLDIIAVSTAEQKSIIDSAAMEQSTIVDRTLTSEHPTESLENNNWYEGSLETWLPRPTASIESHSAELREISNEGSLREIDLNAVGDEFFLLSPRDSTDDEPSSKEIAESPPQTSNRVFTIEESSTDDPFEFHSNHSTTMITNLDDILVDEDEDEDDQQSPTRFLSSNLHRPIQEDILYEVEHENSFSDHSQNTSIIIPTGEQSSSKYEVNIDYLTSTDNHPNSSTEEREDKQQQQQQQQQQSAPNDSRNNNVLPIYILPPLYTTRKAFEQPSSPSLHVDTNNNFEKFDSFVHRFSDLTSPSAYTSQIRHRHYSVGSYYDHKSTTVTTVHPPHSHYFLGSAPVSPLNRPLASSTDSHYRHPSPFSYDHHLSINALRRVNPFLDEEPSATSYRSSSLTREERSRVITYISPRMTSKSAERTIPQREPEPAPIVPPRILSPPSTRMSSVVFPQYEMPVVRPIPTYEMPRPTQRTIFEERPPSTTQENPLYSRIERDKQQQQQQRQRSLSPPPSISRPKTSRGRVHTPPSPPPAVKEPAQNIYQEIDSTSTDEESSSTPNADLQFIRGAIDRVFHFNGQSTTESASDSSTYYEEVGEKEQSSTKKSSSQYPAVQAVQRFYNQKPVLTNGAQTSQSRSSDSKISPPIVARKSQQSKSFEQERASSEEIDDTLNDIEDVEYPMERNKHPTTNKTSQETQTSRSRTTVPAIDIVTEMFIEPEEGDDQDESGHLDAVDGDMVIFYDDIEIVEHSISSSCSSDSDSSASYPSQHYSKPVNTFIHDHPPPPPIPARALKPSHLVNQTDQPKSGSSSTNKTYELEKNLIRKKFDVNTVNGMLSRTDYNLPSSTTHRHPSARHFAGKINPEDSPVSPPQTNGQRQVPPPPVAPAPTTTKNSSATLPTRSNNDKNRSLIADTTALVKQIQNSLSRNSLREIQTNPQTLSTSNRDLRAFVSSTYSPSDENVIDNNGKVHPRPPAVDPDDQTFKRQARLSKSFHNVSEYNPADQRPKKEPKTLPSKSVENNLNEISPAAAASRPKQVPLNLTSLVTSTSFSALPNSDDNARMLSMKWYTGQVSENSEIGHHVHPDDLLHGYVARHSNRETQAILTSLQASTDARVHAALDDIRSRVAQFDASKGQEDLQVFMRYLESRLRDLSSKKRNGQPAEKSRSSSVSTENNKEPLPSRQPGRQQLRSSDQSTPPRRSSQSSSNQENPAVFDEMLNTVLGLPKKGVSALPQNFPSRREKPTPLVTSNPNTNGQDVGKRLFESGTFKDPRLIYDGPKRQEKEDEPLETSV